LRPSAEGSAKCQRIKSFVDKSFFVDKDKKLQPFFVIDKDKNFRVDKDKKLQLFFVDKDKTKTWSFSITPNTVFFIFIYINLVIFFI
jgi:hypothetical protein